MFEEQLDLEDQGQGPISELIKDLYMINTQSQAEFNIQKDSSLRNFGKLRPNLILKVTVTSSYNCL